MAALSTSHRPQPQPPPSASHLWAVGHCQLGGGVHIHAHIASCGVKPAAARYQGICCPGLRRDKMCSRRWYVSKSGSCWHVSTAAAMLLCLLSLLLLLLLRWQRLQLKSHPCCCCICPSDESQSSPPIALRSLRCLERPKAVSAARPRLQALQPPGWLLPGSVHIPGRSRQDPTAAAVYQT